ncbi:MAG: dehydrogenase E1 component subunit alpha/beta [Armatimonadota bacterium]|nr:dehydrogenase E1 component subunit alpha/beta [Armatimonadota bacterium]MDR5703029.1 dehydrogenase E1 component subunit alpha/beta [Armatimonadota bacterium]
MGIFRTTEELYRIMGAFFDRLSQEEQITRRLVQGNFVLRLRFRDPEGLITIDLRRLPISYQFGESALVPDVELTSSADLAHQFWLGRVNIPMAVATRQIVVRGSIRKVLDLLPAITPAFQIYPLVLRELGYADLLPRAAPVRKRRRRLELPFFRPRPKVELERLPHTPIPIFEKIPPEAPRKAPSPLPEDPTALRREMLRRMYLIRTVEERLASEFQAGRLPSEVLYRSTGQEAVGVGVCFALRPDDFIVTTHRALGHAIAKGVEVNSLVAELFGKETGLCRGRGGPMHVADAGAGILATSIVGASCVLATGFALAAKLRGEDRVTVAFLGDGATNQGMFHEAVNLAAVLALPVVFVIENNQYAEFTPLHRHTLVTDLSKRAQAYGIPGVSVDGNDALVVYEAAREMIERARRGGGPSLLECRTYRIAGHTEGEDVVYRTEEEVEMWKAKDPLTRLEQLLLQEGTVDLATVQGYAREANQAVEQALAFARESPEPSVEGLTDFIYAPERAVLFQETPLPRTERQISFSAAIREALMQAMEEDPRVYVIGEDVTTGGYFGVTAGLVERFGRERVIDTPISESAILGSTVGAAMAGMRPVAEIQFADFLSCGFDAILNHASKLRYMSGGQFQLPLVIRAPGGGGLGLGAQHSQSLEALFLHIPGILMVAPATPADAKGLLTSAIHLNNPVLFFEHKLLYATVGPVPEERYTVPLGRAALRREGRDVTVVAFGWMVERALDAARMLEEEGISVEVLDLRTLIPMDTQAVVRSVERTGRLVIVEEPPLTGGVGAEVAARIVEATFGVLRAPVRRVATVDTPLPYNRRLEGAAIPHAERIREAILSIL